MSEREAYIENQEAKLRTWNARLEALQKKAEAKKAEGKVEAMKNLEHLERELGEYESRLRDLKTSGEDAWQRLRDGLKDAASEVEEAITESATKLGEKSR